MPATANGLQPNGLQTTLDALSLENAPTPPPPPTRPLTLRFCVTAASKYGETILLSGDTPPLGSFNPSRAIPLSYEHPGVWTAHIVHSRPPSQPPPTKYKYGRRSVDGLITWERGDARRLSPLPTFCSDVVVRDSWRDRVDSGLEIFSTAAFTDVVFRREVEVRRKIAEAKREIVGTEMMVKGKGSFVVRFEVFVERVREGDEVCVVGDLNELGGGRAEEGVGMMEIGGCLWEGWVAVERGVREFRYWFAIRGDGVKWQGEEMWMRLNEEDGRFLGRGGVVMVDGGRVEVGKWKGCGVALPVFGIRGGGGCGVGEFLGLKKVVDFCGGGGFKLLQLLPVNDTGSWGDLRDSYPYSAVSSFALHPLYINVEAVGGMDEGMEREFRMEKERLNRGSVVDYLGVMDVKMRFLRRLYEGGKEEFLKSKEFGVWFEQNQDWLVPYALFKFFMQVNGTSNYDLWGRRKTISVQEMEELARPDSFHFDYLGLVYFIQFHLHKQLAEAARYAAEKGVVFKGDLPIGVNRYCVDTWVNPHLFRLNMQAGAPPDFFSTNGQNWLFPTYNWDVMKKDNYAWWRSRLSQMAKYFHAYRIDHILGFFRIWEIPEGFRTGMSGRFYPAHAISRQELESSGLWDIDRYVKPYVRDGILQQLFHEDWWKIKDRFFEPLYHDRLQFKKQYNTEKKVEEALYLPADAPESERRFNNQVKEKLFSLFNNVCLLADVEDPDLFHPRFMMQQTSSYAELPSNEWKGALYNLHEDYMYRRQEELWRKNGLERLPMMKSASRMLVCAEDLGFIPKCVPPVMEETSILSLAVQRMPDGDAEFGIPSEYKYECVATTSSHDTSTFRGWWEEISDDMRWRYWTQVMRRGGETPPPTRCTPEIVEWAVADHMASPAMWAIFPLQDLLGMDAELRREDAKAEQINDPSNPNHVWCYRMHVDIDEIIAKADFMNKLARMNKDHNRGVTY